MLAEAFIAQVGTKAENLSFAAARRPEEIRRALWAALAGAGLFAIVIAAGPKDVLRRLFPHMESSGATPVSQREPITGEVSLHYHYPPYTGLSDRTTEASTGEVDAPGRAPRCCSPPAPTGRSRAPQWK